MELIISIMAKLNILKLSEEDIEKIPDDDRWKLLNSDPVLGARHFQYRKEFFLGKLS